MSDLSDKLRAKGMATSLSPAEFVDTAELLVLAADCIDAALATAERAYFGSGPKTKERDLARAVTIALSPGEEVPR